MNRPTAAVAPQAREISGMALLSGRRAAWTPNYRGHIGSSGWGQGATVRVLRCHGVIARAPQEDGVDPERPGRPLLVVAAAGRCRVIRAETVTVGGPCRHGTAVAASPRGAVAACPQAAAAAALAALVVVVVFVTFVVREQHDFVGSTQSVVHGRSINLSIYLSICVSIYLSTYLPINPFFISVSICLSLYPSI